jgi:hypothetical protein
MCAEADFTKDHYINLSNGRFDSTTRADLDHTFQTWRAAEKPLVAHFHGGLVNEKSGMEVARKLLPVYSEAGGFPFFFVWEAGLGETILQNLRDIYDERIFRRLLERIVQFAVGKLQQAPGTRGTRLALPPLPKVQDELRDGSTAQREPYEHIDPASLSPNEAMAMPEEQQFREELEADSVINLESQAIANQLMPPEETNAERARSRGARAQASRHTLMSPDVLEDIRKETSAPGARSGLVTTRIIVGGVRVLAKVIDRFRNRTDHGIYVTAIEEILREFYVANVGQYIWAHMKEATANAFKPDGKVHGGAAFLENLKAEWEAGNRRRVVLIGHSTGAVYICHLLQHAAKQLPAEIRFDVVFLAPACTFDLFNDTLEKAADRITEIRVFAMHDALEINDQLVPAIFPRSLLYFVSGVVEDKPDMPLVGMKRYYSGRAPYDGNAIQSTCRFLATKQGRSVWSEVAGASGLSSSSHRHGDFDDDGPTLESLRHIIASGW